MRISEVQLIANFFRRYYLRFKPVSKFLACSIKSCVHETAEDTTIWARVVFVLVTPPGSRSGKFSSTHCRRIHRTSPHSTDVIFRVQRSVFSLPRKHSRFHCVKSNHKSSSSSEGFHSGEEVTKGRGFFSPPNSPLLCLPYGLKRLVLHLSTNI